LVIPNPLRTFPMLMKQTEMMDIEILADRWEEEQAILKQLAVEDLVTQGEVRIFNNVNDELPF